MSLIMLFKEKSMTFERDSHSKYWEFSSDLVIQNALKSPILTTVEVSLCRADKFVKFDEFNEMLLVHTK